MFDEQWKVRIRQRQATVKALISLVLLKKIKKSTISSEVGFRIHIRYSNTSPVSPGVRHYVQVHWCPSIDSGWQIARAAPPFTESNALVAQLSSTTLNTGVPTNTKSLDWFWKKCPYSNQSILIYIYCWSCLSRILHQGFSYSKCCISFYIHDPQNKDPWHLIKDPA